MKKRVLALLLCAVLAFAALPVAASATVSSGVYLALGDSITAGYGLTTPATQGFPAIVTADQNVTLVNAAVSGAKMSGVLTWVNDPANVAQIQSANLITITAGGNDLMEALYTAIGAAMTPPKTAAEVKTLLAANDLATLGVALGVLPTFSTNPAFVAALGQFTADLTATAARIRALNTHATVLIPTQYNPYYAFQNNPLFGVDVYTSFDACIQLMDNAIRLNASTLYQVPDVYAAFAASAAPATLCNATVSPISLDFHPNAAGHAVIASTMLGLAYTITNSGASSAANGITGTPSSLPAAHAFADIPCQFTLAVSGTSTSAQRFTASAQAKKSDNTVVSTVSAPALDLLAGEAVPAGTTASGTFTMPAANIQIGAAVNMSSYPLTSVSIDNASPVIGTAVNAAVVPAGAGVTWQWQANGTDIAGATSASFTPTAAEVGKVLTVKATGTGSFSGTVTSTATAAVAGVPMVLTAGSATFTAGKSQDVTFTIGSGIAGFTSTNFGTASLDGAALTPGTDFTLQGSPLTLTLTKSRLDALAAGSHTLTVTLQNGVFAGLALPAQTFTVKSAATPTPTPTPTPAPAAANTASVVTLAATPATGDAQLPGVWLALLLASGACLTFAGVRKKRR